MSLGANKQALMGAAGASGSGTSFYDYQIEQSLMFSGNADYLSRTNGSGGNRKTWTYSVWFKKLKNIIGNTSDSYTLISTTGGDYFRIAFPNYSSSNYYDRLDVYQYPTSVNFETVTSNRLQDGFGWYHFVLRVDTTQSSAADRVRQYLNGHEVTEFFADTTGSLAQDFDTDVNVNGQTTWIGSYSTAEYWPGYMADVALVDGQSYDCTKFGEFKNGVWIPKDLSSGITWGSQGFWLKFASGALGTDSSGNGNNFTATGFVASQTRKESPTHNSSSIGGRFWNWNMNAFPYYGSVTLGAGNTQFTNSSGTYEVAGTTQGLPLSGKFYCEFVPFDAGQAIGFMQAYEGMPRNYGNYTGPGSYAASQSPVWVSASGTITIQDGSTVSGSTWTTGDNLAIAVDLDNNKAYFAKNNTWQNSADPANGTNGLAITRRADGWLALMCMNYGNKTMSINSGVDSSHYGYQTAGTAADENGIGNFKYAPPSGFLALCTASMPTPAADPASETDSGDGGSGPQNFYQALKYAGSNGSNSHVVTTKLNADGGWFKRTDSTKSWLNTIKQDYGASNLYAQFNLNSYGTASAPYSGVKASSATSITLGDVDYINWSGMSYIASLFNAGGSLTNETGGDIDVDRYTSSERGITIGKYTGTGSNGVLKHGLGVKPAMVITKATSANNGWALWHCGYDNGDYDSFAECENGNAWNANQGVNGMFTTNPDTTDLPFTAYARVNASSTTYQLWCFATTEGFSKFGSYEGIAGSGSPDYYPFIHCGFEPAFIMVRYVGSGESWVQFTREDEGYNYTTKNVRWNGDVAYASGTTYNIRFYSTGFSPITSWEGLNGSGYKIVYAAFAHNPMKYATGGLTKN